MKAILGLLRRLWKAETFSPTAFVFRALVVTVLFCISEILGLREYTTFLSGTSANVTLGWSVTSALGLSHLLLYFGFILLAPISLLTAGLIAAWNRYKRKPVMEAQAGRIATTETR
jgi:membrane protein implicated in regulation of membrane protease activity